VQDWLPLSETTRFGTPAGSELGKIVAGALFDTNRRLAGLPGRSAAWGVRRPAAGFHNRGSERPPPQENDSEIHLVGGPLRGAIKFQSRFRRGCRNQSMSHDQNFKNLILDYPQAAIGFFTECSSYASWRNKCARTWAWRLSRGWWRGIMFTYRDFCSIAYDEIREARSPPLPLWERVGVRERSGARRPFILRGGSTRPMIVSCTFALAHVDPRRWETGKHWNDEICGNYA
jgi:hypothetical protein